MAEPELFTDIDLSFTPLPRSGDLGRKVNEAAIQRAFNHLARIESFDIPFRPDIRSGVRDYLFSNFDRIDLANIKKDIEYSAAKVEPRIKIKEIRSTIQSEGVSATFQVFYTCQSLNIDGDFNLIVERVR